MSKLMSELNSLYIGLGMRLWTTSPFRLVPRYSSHFGNVGKLRQAKPLTLQDDTVFNTSSG